jgi:hypothetical protein
VVDNIPADEKVERAKNNGNMSAGVVPDLYTPEQGMRWGESGLTKRELFAAMAMQGMCTPLRADISPASWNHANIAEGAVKAADALLAALDVTEKNNGT